MANTHLPPNWRERLLHVIGAPIKPENMRLLDAWARAEGGTAKWNPLNSSMVLPGSTKYNSTGVQNYPRSTWGVCANALTLTNGLYGGILGDLQAGTKTAESIVQDRTVQFNIWGTSTTLLLTILKENP